MKKTESNWMQRTHQKWKEWLSLLLMLPGFIVWFFVGIESVVFWAVIGIALIGAAFGALAIRCPKCIANVGWTILNTRKPVAILAFVQECPSCGDVGGGEAAGGGPAG